ncbi:TPA: hypothetical protein L3N00_004623 [Vibrio parahaemolyticus]|nr:hypothetical protein [Vibrio parahaemolyticus]HBN6272033.1 hypothetical protein [Vibrio parahaemolyticus]
MRFLKSAEGQQPVNARLIRCGELGGLFESRGCGSHFINKAFKTDSQRWAVLVANCGAVFKVALLSLVERCSPLNAALVANEKIAAKTECLGLIVRVLCSILHFELQDLGLRN